MRKYLYLLLSAILWAGSCNEKCDPINAELTGNWERVDGNNAPFNGMVVHFESSSGKLTKIPETAAGFAVDDIKWKNVTRVGEGVYNLEDRNSAGVYYGGTKIFVLADGKELIISSSTSTIGDYQKWKRI